MRIIFAYALIVTILFACTVCANAQQVPFNDPARHASRIAYAKTIIELDDEFHKKEMAYCATQEDNFIGAQLVKTNSLDDYDYYIRQKWAETTDGKFCLNEGFMP